MRHRVFGKKLSRDRNHRKALFKNLINALVLHGQIKTTEAKAKAVRGLAEKLITKAKGGSVSSRRLIGGFLQSKASVSKLVDEIAPLFKSRPGGFTRVVRLGKRRGDDTMMVRLELIEKPKTKEADSQKKKASDRKTVKLKTEKKTQAEEVKKKSDFSAK